MKPFDQTPREASFAVAILVDARENFYEKSTEATAL